MKEEPNIGLYFRIISKEIKQLIDSSLNNDLTNIQIAILCYIDRNKNKEIYQKDIEKKLGLRKSTISGILSTMIKNGIITRTESTNDLRSKEIKLTDKGLKLDKVMKKKALEFENLLQKNIDPKDLEIFYKVTNQIQDNLRGENEC